MNHPKPEEWVPYLFGEPGAEAARHLNAHLSECPECRAELESWRRSLRRLDQWKLPRPQPAPLCQSALKFAVAAVVVFAFALGLGLGYGVSAGRSTEPLRAQVEASVKASLFAQLRQQWMADMQNSQAVTRAQITDADEALEGRLADASDKNLRQAMNGFVQLLTVAREEDRRALKLLLQEEQSRHDTDSFELRRDLETVAAMTDQEIRSARYRLAQLSIPTLPGEK